MDQVQIFALEENSCQFKQMLGFHYCKDVHCTMYTFYFIRETLSYNDPHFLQFLSQKTKKLTPYSNNAQNFEKSLENTWSLDARYQYLDVLCPSVQAAIQVPLEVVTRLRKIHVSLRVGGFCKKDKSERNQDSATK